MRRIALTAVIPLALLAGSCWTPGPGQLDPTRYPWDQPNLRPEVRATQPQGTYCVVMLERASNSGITFGDKGAVQLGCTPPAAASAAQAEGESITLSREIGPGITQHIRIAHPTPEQRAAYEAEKKQAAEPKWVVAAPPPGPPPHEPTPREVFARECADHDQRIARLGARYPVKIAGSTARVRQSVWRAMARDDQHQLIWNLAFHASCWAGARMMVDVRILDLQGQPLRRQRVSTELACHGDMVGGPPDAPWYLC